MFKRLSSKNYDKLFFLFTKYITNKCLIKWYENNIMFEKFQQQKKKKMKVCDFFGRQCEE